MENLEAKFRCGDLAKVRMLALEAGAQAAGAFTQDDLFFPAPNTRLKLRRFEDGSAELIAYRREDRAGARISEYHRFRTDDPAALEAVLRHALGAGARLVKRRELLLYSHTRIHLDAVRELGTFVELETVIRDQSRPDAEKELLMLIGRLELDREEELECAYADLLPSP
jgi:predicted adenylyl cyclase CyaB